MDKSTKELGKTFVKPKSQDENTQTSFLEKVTVSQALRDTLTHMKESKNFLELLSKPNGKVFWNGVYIKRRGKNRIKIIDKVFEITSDYEKNFFKTIHTTRHMNGNDKESVYDILESVCFYNMKQNKRLCSSRLKNARNMLPKDYEKKSPITNTTS